MATRGGRKQHSLRAVQGWKPRSCALGSCSTPAVDSTLRACTDHLAHALRVIAAMPSSARRYGVTPGDYWIAWARFDGLCAICRNPERSSMLVVDHNHATGEVRGLLCSRCNTGIGLLGDSPDFLSRAAAYLHREGSYAERPAIPKD